MCRLYIVKRSISLRGKKGQIVMNAVRLSQLIQPRSVVSCWLGVLAHLASYPKECTVYIGRRA